MEKFRYGLAMTHINDQGHESPLSRITYIGGENLEFSPPSVAIDEGLKSLIVTSEAAPSNVRGVRYYRTINIDEVETVGEQGFTVYFHSALATGGPVFMVDDHPDRELGLPFDHSSVGTFPRGARFATIFKNTLFCDAGSEYPDRIRHSHPGKIEQMPEGNLIPVGDQAAGQPTGIRSTKNAVVDL